MWLNRRHFLSATAASAAALAFPGLAFSAEGAATTPRRFIFIRKSNGIRPLELALPTFSAADKATDAKKGALEVDLAKHELPAWLQAVNPYKKHMTILQGLSCKMNENGHFSYQSIMGCFKSNRGSLSAIKRATIDFELAKLYPSPYGHVELSLTGDYAKFRTGIVPGYSAPGPHQRNYCYADPQTAFNELFKSVLNPEGVNVENSMLEFLHEHESNEAKDLIGYEKLKLSGQADALAATRERNQKVRGMADKIRKYMPTIAPIHENGGANASTPEKQKAMTDVLIAALVTGLTNVVTYTIDELSTPIVGLPGNEGDHISIHELGHNGGYSGRPADDIRETIRKGHMEQIATIVEALKKVPEGNGTMFDSTMIMYFPEGGETHHGHGTESPWLIIAGDKCGLNQANFTSRYIRLPYLATEGHKPLGCWYTTLLNANGNPIEHYGDLDLDMSRLKLDQTGAIKQFIS